MSEPYVYDPLSRDTYDAIVYNAVGRSRIQPINATVFRYRSAGVSWPSVLRDLSFNLRATSRLRACSR